MLSRLLQRSVCLSKYPIATNGSIGNSVRDLYKSIFVELLKVTPLELTRKQFPIEHAAFAYRISMKLVVIHVGYDYFRMNANFQTL